MTTAQLEPTNHSALASKGNLLYDRIRLPFVGAPGDHAGQGQLRVYRRGQFSDAHDVAVDARGHVFVLDTWNSRIPEFDGEGKFVQAIGPKGLNLFAPKGIAIRDKLLYVTDSGNSRIAVVQMVTW